jgi:hypothetical protein
MGSRRRLGLRYRVGWWRDIPITVRSKASEVSGQISGICNFADLLLPGGCLNEIFGLAALLREVLQYDALGKNSLGWDQDCGSKCHLDGSCKHEASLFVGPGSDIAIAGCRIIAGSQA